MFGRDIIIFDYRFTRLQPTRIRQNQRVVHHIDVSIECLRVGGVAGGEERIDGGEAAVAVLLHPGFGEVEARFGVVLVAGEFLVN